LRHPVRNRHAGVAVSPPCGSNGGARHTIHTGADHAIGTGGVTLRSVDMVFPDSDRVFDGGTAAEAMNSNCLACHSAGMVLNQPALSQMTWKDEVDKMRNTYKAPVAPDDVAAIVAYLTALSGKK
jgi:mono/diheme cytochrome c family protein